MLQEIIQAVDKKLIERELTKNKFIRFTNNGNNEIYIVSSLDSPNIIQEIGRLRELTFRLAGGGTGKSIDLDDFDIGDNPYKQLIVWSPTDKEIVGGYRFIRCADAKKDENGNFLLATSHLFKFSKKFENEYMPYTIELGRSFVQPHYQAVNDHRKGLYSLDNIWDGLGAIVIDNPEIKNLFNEPLNITADGGEVDGVEFSVPATLQPWYRETIDYLLEYEVNRSVCGKIIEE